MTSRNRYRRRYWYSLGRTIREWRKAEGVSQQYVSDQLMLLGYDLCQESISSTEIGDREISAAEFWLIAHVLHVDEQTVLQALRDILK
jgi:transcriptional regulator with XRE-family HTH domain